MEASPHMDRVVHWAKQSLLLDELLSHMTSLYTVMQQAHANNPNLQFVVAVPPDETLPPWACGGGRVSQAFVRSHIFRLRHGKLHGLSENVTGILTLTRPQPAMSQAPADSDSDAEAEELFGTSASRIVSEAQEREYADAAAISTPGAAAASLMSPRASASSPPPPATHRSAQVALMNSSRERPSARASKAGGDGEGSNANAPALETLRTGPLEGTLRLVTSWSSTDRMVTTYALELVRNASRTGDEAEPFLRLLFVDEPVYCYLNWTEIETGSTSRLTSNQVAQAASIQQGIDGSRAPTVDAAALLDTATQRRGESREDVSWLAKLFASIAYATPKPPLPSSAAASDGVLALAEQAPSLSVIPPPQQQQRAGGAFTARSTTAGDAAGSARKGQRDVPRTFEAAPMFRSLLTLISDSAADKVLLRLDTEAVIFESTYVCVTGFEEFTVAKVNAIVESLTQQFLDAVVADGVAAKATEQARRVAAEEAKKLKARASKATAAAAAAAARKQQGTEQAAEVAEVPKSVPCPLELPSGAKGTLVDGIPDADVDIVVSAVHAITTAAFAGVLLPHWRKVHAADDHAFARHCRALSDEISSRLRGNAGGKAVNMLGIDIARLPHQALEPAAVLTREFSRTYSVFTYMRVAERILGIAMNAMAAEGVVMTADMTIPVLVYLLARGAPDTLRSTIAFVTSFSLQALDMSALGYSFTTIEAAAHQLVQEVNDERLAGKQHGRAKS
jgi:hypothetical protein